MALPANQKIARIAQAPLFSHCSKRDLAKIAQLADEVDLPEGRVLIREGESGREMLVLLSGHVEVRRKGRKLATLGPGDMVGEMALVSQVPRVATVTTTTPVEALVLTGHQFRGLLQQHPDLQLKVLRSVSDRLAEIVD